MCDGYSGYWLFYYLISPTLNHISECYIRICNNCLWYRADYLIGEYRVGIYCIFTLLVFDNYSTCCIVYCIIEYIISRESSVKEIPPVMALVKNIRFSWSVGWVFEVGGFDYQRWKRLYEEFFKSHPNL